MENLFTVVDENDKIIWYKTKESIDPINKYYRVSALRVANLQSRKELSCLRYNRQGHFRMYNSKRWIRSNQIDFSGRIEKRYRDTSRKLLKKINTYWQEFVK